MYHKTKIVASSALALLLTYSNAFAAKGNNSDSLHKKTVDNEVKHEEDFKGGLVLGFEGGVSMPVVKSFTHKSSKTKVSLKRSPVYTGIIGYEFEPGMFLEFSVSRQPKFSMGIKLPDDKGVGKTKASGEIYMLSLVYDLMDVGVVTPYVVLGGGLAKVKVKEVEINHPTSPIPLTSMKTVKKASNSFAWEAGVGAAYKINDNLRITALAKLQVINNIKLRYKSLNKDTLKTEDRGQMKKTIGVGEFTVGLKYSLPF